MTWDQSVLELSRIQFRRRTEDTLPPHQWVSLVRVMNSTSLRDVGSLCQGPDGSC